jgi:hypothetical protein
MDLAVGPVLAACTFGMVVYRLRTWRSAGVFALAALPGLALHHALNFHIGGTWKPANAVPEYFNWPGCSFDATNMTGVWTRSSLLHFLTYAGALLVGKRGFLGHNLPLFLGLLGCIRLLRERSSKTPELCYAACLCTGVWLMYAIASNNYSGQCCSIRWFVPLLTPVFWVLTMLLNRHREYWPDFLVLSGWGALCAGLMWWKGPWMQHMVPGFWVIQAGALASWGLVAWQRHKRQRLGALLQPAGFKDGSTDKSALRIPA